MKLGDIKANTGDRVAQKTPNDDIKARLREEGLKQATRFQETQVSLSTSQSTTQLGVRVLSGSFQQTISFEQGKAIFEAPPKKKDSLFDFEEVAKNVLNFVGGAIKAAKMNGGDEDELNSMFEQATSGVLKGVEMARKDLAGFMNEEIDDGINKSLDLIRYGIDKLRDEIFGNTEEVSEGAAVAISNSAIYSKSESGEIEITTRDGDVVMINFEDAQRLELNQQLVASTNIPQREQNTASSDDTEQTNNQTAEQGNAQSNESGSAASQSENENEQAGNSSGNTNIQYQESLSFFQQSGLSFSVEGELDEGEKQAIADLVGNVKDLAESFFADDVESAFNKALELGFDEQELSGYALQFNKTESVQIAQSYGAVSQYTSDGEEDDTARNKQVRPISDYLQEMMATMEKASERLNSRNDLDSLVNGLMSKVGSVKTDDLLAAINQFNNFNNRVLDNVAEKPEFVSDSE